MPSYETAPQVDTYIANPGNPPAVPSPCSDDSATPQKVCGTTSPPGPGETTELQWAQYTHTTNGSANTASPLSATSLIAQRALISADSGNAANVGVGPTASANLYSIPAGVGGYVIEMPDGTSFDLADWFSISTDVSQTLRVAYIPG